MSNQSDLAKSAAGLNGDPLSIDTANNRVGIGAAPSFSTLELTADKTTADNLQLTLRGSTNTNKQMILGFDTTSDKSFITSQIAGSAQKPLVINASAVGIGTSSPAQKLNVNGRFQIDAGWEIKLQNAAQNGFAIIQNVGAGTNTDLGFSTAGSERMRIDSAGRVTMPYQPAFSTRGTNYTQVYDNSTYSIVIGNTIDLNIGNHYNTSTGRFTAPVAGNYIFNANGLIYPSNTTTVITAGWFKNGSDWQTTQSGETTTNHMHYSNIVLMPLATNDIVDFRLRTSGTAKAYQAQFNMHGYLLG